MLRLISICSISLLIALPAIESITSEHTVRDVNLPYYSKFPVDVKPGTLIILEGLVKANPDRFAIDLVRKVKNDVDVIFHLNPRFRQRSVVRNTRIGGNWGREEREVNLMPIKPNEKFQIAILVTSESYKVFINGKYFTDYKHRLPYSSVNGYGMWGDIIVGKFQIIRDPLFANINNIVPLLKSPHEDVSNEIVKQLLSKDKFGKLSDGKGRRNVHLHFDLSVDGSKNALNRLTNNQRPSLKIDANFPVNKK